MERKELLRRMIMGLEQQIPELRERMKYYEKDDLELKYSEKFLASMEKNLTEAQKELESLAEKDE
jgi:hypothetical protein